MEKDHNERKLVTRYKESLLWNQHTIQIEIKKSANYLLIDDIFVYVDGEFIAHTNHEDAFAVASEYIKDRREIPKNIHTLIAEKIKSNTTNGFFSHQNRRIPIEVKMILMYPTMPKSLQEFSARIRYSFLKGITKDDFKIYSEGTCYFVVTIDGETHTVGKRKLSKLKETNYGGIFGGLLLIALGILMALPGRRIVGGIIFAIFGVLCIAGSIAFESRKK